MRAVGTYFLGTLLLMVGVLLLIHVMEWATIDMAFIQKWWTLFLIIPCTIRLLFDGDKFLSLIGIVSGVILFMAHPDRNYLGIDYTTAFELVIPLVIIFLGIKLLARGKKKPVSHRK